MIRGLKKITVPAILARKQAQQSNPVQKISALTAYDFTMARIVDSAGVDIILVGDSVSSVVQGLKNTLPVTVEEMIYHCRCVSRGVTRALLVGDMPFLSYQVSIERAIENAGRFVKEGNVAAVKLEGGLSVAKTIQALVNVDIPVMGHVGLTPQSYHRMGGFRVQGKSSSNNLLPGSRERVFEDAIAVEEAGAFCVVLEGVPEDLAKEITERLSIPTIGIGAGPHCDGQILVTHDMLGLGLEHTPEFVKKYLNLAALSAQAIESFVSEVQNGEFPVSKLETDGLAVQNLV